jgi:DNA recombination protein RmuC
MRGREAAEAASSALRREVLGSVSTLGETLRVGLEGFRTDNAASAERLRSAVDTQLATLSQRLIAFTSESTRHHNESREALHTRLTELSATQSAHQDKLREAMQQRIDKLNADNAAKLEEMRATVDEKLQKTLHTRLTESFGAVTEQLTRVHTGLGEMTTLAAGVGDLKRVLSNVKSRGIVGEFFLGQQLEQMFSADQYIANAPIKGGNYVEYALKVPNGPDSTVLLALDSKFPVEDWERLEDAYENGTDDDRKRASVAFERAIRAEGKRICEKYIDPPQTLPFAIMYLPTEALYAEVMRRPGLHAEIQSQCNVVIAGPSAFTMILTSFQLVFRTVKFQKNLNEVYGVFQVAQKEFEKFGGLMEKVETQVGTVQKTLKEISGKTKTVNRAFRNVSRLELDDAGSAGETVSQNVLHLLAASEDE